MRTRLLAALAAVAAVAAVAAMLALATAALSAQAPAATAAPGTVVGSALTVKLTASPTTALQYHGVEFQAKPSTAAIVAYAFAYGDGAIEYSDSPIGLHGYQRPGTYHARVGVLDSSGHVAVSMPVTVHVIDGVPPVVRIDHPGPSQRVRLGRGGITFSGSARDADGIRKVEIAIQLVSSARHFKTGGDCIWYDGHVWLLLASCSAPHYFAAAYAHGHWRFRMSGRSRIPAGTYEIQVRAIDRAGNISHYYDVSLRTIFPFQIVR